MTAQRPPRILVVEDDRVLQELVAELLLEAGYDVVTASDGDEALKLARFRPPDLVLLDVTMPRMDGYAVCREIRAAGPTAPPVVFLTAHGNVEDRVAGLDLGAVDYLVKPFNPPELEARVRAALRTKAALDTLVADASTDPLTGLLNQNQVAERAGAAVTLAQRHQRPLACVVLGLDGFDAIAERWGTAAAEAVLREVARRLRERSRQSDVLARYGRASFLLLMPETDARGAGAAAERLQHVAAETPVRLPDDPSPYHVTLSAGIVDWSPALPDANALLNAGWQALARARAAGPGAAVRAP